MNAIKKIRTVIIALLLTVLAGLPAAAAPVIDPDDGYYMITSEADLTWLATTVNGGSFDTNAKLMNDITLTSPWSHPIGENTITPLPTVYYSGTFDGRGHKISGLNVPSTVTYGGLFSWLYAGGIVKNLTVDGTVDGWAISGGIASQLAGSSAVYNCLNLATINASTAGGVVGALQNNAMVFNCANKGNITTSFLDCGGVVAHAVHNAKIINCTNEGIYQDTGGSSNLGGICGRLEDSAQVLNCANVGTVGGTPALNTGVMIGYISSATCQVGTPSVSCWYKVDGALAAIGSNAGSPVYTANDPSSTQIPVATILLDNYYPVVSADSSSFNITATAYPAGSANAAAGRPLPLTVPAAIAFDVASLPSATTQLVNVTGGAANTSYPIIVSGDNAIAPKNLLTASIDFTITVLTPISVPPASLDIIPTPLNVTAGTPILPGTSIDVVASGDTAPYTGMVLSNDTSGGWTAAALNIAGGLTLTPNPATGKVDVTGTGTIPGTYVVDVQVTKGTHTYVGQMVIVVGASAIISGDMVLTPSPVLGTVGTALSQAVSVMLSGDMPPFTTLALSYSGMTYPSPFTIPGIGVTLTANPTTGSIMVSGTPTVAGTYTIDVNATTGLGSYGPASFDIIITNPASVITITPSPIGVVVGAVSPITSLDVVVSGDPFPYASMMVSSDSVAWQPAVTIAGGLTLTANPATGKIDFTGTGTIPGTYTIDVQVVSPSGTHTETFTITVGASSTLALAPSATVTGVVGTAISESRSLTFTPALTITGVLFNSQPSLTFNGLTVTWNAATGQIDITGTPTASGSSVVTLTVQSGSYSTTTSLLLNILASASDLFNLERVKLFDDALGYEYFYNGHNFYANHSFEVFLRGDASLANGLKVEVQGPRDVGYKTLTYGVDYWVNNLVQWDDWDQFDGGIFMKTVHLNLPTLAQRTLTAGTYLVRLSYTYGGVPSTQVLTLETSGYSDGGKGGDGSSGGCNAGMGLAGLAVTLLFLKKRRD